MFSGRVEFEKDHESYLLIYTPVHAFKMICHTTKHFIDFLRDIHSLQQSFCQNKNISFAIYLYSYKIYIYLKRRINFFSNNKN